MPRVQYLVVGSGLTGAVIARLLADRGEKVVILDRRGHHGGNVHDFMHTSGIRVHTYGPHYFRTNNVSIWEFVNRFAEFQKFEAVLGSLVDGRVEHWPVTSEYIERTVGPDWEPAFVGEPANFEEASLAMMPEPVYRKFVKGYTEKQWGVDACTLSADLAGRFDVRTDGEVRLKTYPYQGVPADGYARFMERLLDGIPVELERDWLAERDEWDVARATIFTGPIDELFGFDQGRLAYRGQRREHVYVEQPGFVQPLVQVNNPDPATGPHIRTIEWKHMMPAEFDGQETGSVITREVPFSPELPSEFEYPFPDPANARLYEQYRVRANRMTNLIVCGRLGEYRYYDMDQAIGRARVIARRLLAE
jgi:UDP-galactopyranose mutase